MKAHSASSSDATAGGAVVVHVFGRTDVGRTREHNEDALLIADFTADHTSLEPKAVRTHEVGARGALFMVADGMGGAAAGEIASEMATTIVLRELRQDWLVRKNPTPDAFAAALKHAAVVANAEINAFAGHHAEYRGMGTTATIAGLLGDTLYVAQVGDSRAYIVRGGVARQITKDQSLMQKLVEAGELTEEEAEHSERRNIILQALGPETVVKIDLTQQTVRRDDVLVLCSDGLSGQVSRDQIAEVIRDQPDLAAVCRRLIDLANSAGGPDNITVIAARFDGAGLSPAAHSDEVGYRAYTLLESGHTPTGVDSVLDDPSRHVTMPVRAVTRAAVPVSPPAVTEERRARGRTFQRWLLGALVLAVVAAAWWMVKSRG